MEKHITTTRKYALIAGKGILPFFLKKKIEEEKKILVTIGIKEFSPEGFFPDYSVKLGELEKLLNILRKENAENLFLSGKIEKTKIMNYKDWDKLSLKFFSSLKNFHDRTILRSFQNYLEKEGFIFPSPERFLQPWIAGKGLLTSRKPEAEEEKDLALAWEVGKKISSLEIGHTVVVRGGAVTAVETVEGTDEAILRGGKYGKGGGVAKVPRPEEDLRFDPPSVGVKTLEVMERVGIKALAIGAGKTIIVEKENFINKANSLNFSVVGWIRK